LLGSSEYGVNIAAVCDSILHQIELHGARRKPIAVIPLLRRNNSRDLSSVIVGDPDTRTRTCATSVRRFEQLIVKSKVFSVVD